MPPDRGKGKSRARARKPLVAKPVTQPAFGVPGVLRHPGVA